MTYAEILKRMNAGSHPRSPGGSPPPVCEVYWEVDDNGKKLINAIFGFEIINERLARPEDEAAVMAVLAEITEAMAKRQA